MIFSQLIIDEPHHHEEKEKESDFFADCENDNFNAEANLSEPSTVGVLFCLLSFCVHFETLFGNK